MSEPPYGLPQYGYAPPPPPIDPLISPEVAQSFALRDLSRAADTGVDRPPFGTFLAASALGLGAAVLATLVSTVVTPAVVRLVVQAATGGQPTIAECLGFAARRLLPMVGWGLVAGLIIFAGVCACFLPAIYFGAVFTVLAPIVALERTGPISRCFKLFHGDLGASVARVATIAGLGIGAAVVAGVVDVIGGLVASPESASAPAFVISALVTSAIAVAIAGAVRILTDPLTVAAYADMRARVEPLNSAILAHEAAVR
jgi:hypothetical protein